MARQSNQAAYTLKKNVTIGSLRMLQGLGLTTVDGVKFSEALLKAMADESSLRALCDACFAGDFSTVPVEEIDLMQVSQGVKDFLASLINPSRN